jgi:hypothetical protein
MSEAERPPIRRLRASPAWGRAAVADRDTVELVATWLAPIARRFWDLDQLRSEPAAVATSDLTNDQVRTLLRRFGDRLGERVLALWYWDVVAAFLNYRDFVEYFDDLWLPSAEDLWLVGGRERAFLTLNHEEYLVVGTVGVDGEIQLLS